MRRPRRIGTCGKNPSGCQDCAARYGSSDGGGNHRYRQYAALICFITAAICFKGLFRDTYAEAETIDLSGMDAIAEQYDVSIAEAIGSLLNGDANFAQLLREAFDASLESTVDSAVGFLPPVLAILIFSNLIRLIIGRNSKAGNAFRLICSLSVIGLIASMYLSARDTALLLLGRMKECTEALTPALITVTSMTGAETYGTALSVLGSAASDMMQGAFLQWGLPLCTVCAVVALIGNLPGGIRLNQLHSTVRKCLQWGVGIAMTFYMGILNIQGSIASGRDGMAERTVRYALESIVPMVGGNLSDSLGGILYSASAVRNAVGVGGLLLITLHCLLPVISLSVSLILAKLLSAIAEPLGDGNITAMFSQTADAVEMLLVICVASVLIGMLLTGSCMSGIGNMMR